MKIRISNGMPRFCDMGIHDGMYRVDIVGTIYLTADELASYYAASEEFSITIPVAEEK